MNRSKTLDDFPHFIPAGIRRGTTAPDGYTRFELYGWFDCSINENLQDWFFVLWDERNSLCVTLQSFDKETNAAILTCDEKDEPLVVGKPLAYLNNYWQPYKIWMVLEPGWGWARKQFLGVDALAEDFAAEGVSVIDGREVKVWTKLEPLRTTKGKSRHVPTNDQDSVAGSGSRLIPLGWDHEHCELCNTHIDMGNLGYSDPDDHWVCENCFERFVVHHDVAFVDGL